MSILFKLVTAQLAVFLIAPLALTSMLANAQGEKPIYRCASKDGVITYTNYRDEAGRQGCTALSGGNVTVITGTKVSGAPNPVSGSSTVRVASAAQAGSRIDTTEQRSRDSDSKAILDIELKKAEIKQAELIKEYSNGEPGKIGGEAQNYQKYIDRVAEMKANIARNESDIAGIKRELGRR